MIGHCLRMNPMTVWAALTRWVCNSLLTLWVRNAFRVGYGASTGNLER